MTHIITRLCLRDTACVEVCPVECMVLGQPEAEWPWLVHRPGYLHRLWSLCSRMPV